MRKTGFVLLAVMLVSSINVFAQDQVKIANGTLEGTTNSATGIRSFKGIPFAAPPVGDLRWKEPQPVQNWTGVRKADHFGNNAMQKNVFGDMMFRSAGMSEDCLYLNVWTPAKSSKEKLPVLVYFYGGGFVAGDGSESRYDGESMAQKGIVTLTVNYRLGVFGFLSHPELTAESPHHASGDYGLLDQYAALEWVKKNISAFGGDPDKVTIAGESAGSIAVCAQMASPLSKNLIAGAIGESGGMINPTLPAIPLADGEKNGVAFAQKVNASSLAALRAIPADQLLELASKQGNPPMSPTVDGYFLTKTPAEVFATGEQAKVPLLVGWNSAEVPYQALMWGDLPTPENYLKKLKSLYNDKADEVLKLYPGSTQDEVIKSATELGSDRFIVYSTWKWADLAAQTGGKSVYTYVFGKPRPPMVAAMGNAKAGLAGGVIKDGTDDAKSKAPAPYTGASHASEIEYAMGNLAGNKVYDWKPEDYKVSATMEDYFANFIKTGNPNGNGLTEWKANKGSVTQSININVETKLEPVATARYQFLDQIYTKK
ncbi:carboxylesterase/lipase family protein [Mucilaginibacter sp. McL0603]|uniref:carboxylesterase/lipase family protein n=1 Tax=Mucilaginibacter sp. McL0603 TaxID=3415670 RepID=UPI003CF44A09